MNGILLWIHKSRQFVVFVYRTYDSIPERYQVMFGFYLVISTGNSFCLMTFIPNLIHLISHSANVQSAAA